MFNSKFNTLLTALLIIAIIAIVIIIGYFGYSIYNKYFIEAGAKEAVDNFEQATRNNIQQTENTVDGNVTIGDGTYDNTINSSSTSMTTYQGYNVIGTIRIPEIDIEYPILDKTSIKALKIAVGYLSGAGINQVGNTVIQGHNYKNGTFFSDVDRLSNGDKIYIKDTTGTEITYEVYRNFTASSTDTSFYNRDTEGKREITLSTCTDNDDTKRTIILAREV